MNSSAEHVFVPKGSAEMWKMEWTDKVAPPTPTHPPPPDAPLPSSLQGHTIACPRGPLEWGKQWVAECTRARFTNHILPRCVRERGAGELQLERCSSDVRIAEAKQSSPQKACVWGAIRLKIRCSLLGGIRYTIEYGVSVYRKCLITNILRFLPWEKLDDFFRESYPTENFIDYFVEQFTSSIK